MVRTYKRKTDRDVDENSIKIALKDCLRKKVSIREAARLYNINRNTLMSRIKAAKRKGTEVRYLQDSDSGMSGDEASDRQFHSKYSVNQVFSVVEEDDLVQYIKNASALHYGLTYKQIRSLAYEFACNIPNCKMPTQWAENKTAGEDWLYGFMARHSDLSLRKPESTSILRSTGFNQDRVKEFFDNYSSVLNLFKFQAENIFNVDESGITTVMSSPRIVAEKGKKQVGQISSGERGELVTFVGIINALGNSLPPAYVVPRMRNPEQYITDAPASSLILNNKTGWMTQELFIKVLQHIQAHTKCSLEQPILILLDNHESHIAYQSIKFCKDNGISLVSFPPHTSHRLQPLDVGVFGPFKGSLSVAFNDWLLSNPGKPITIRNVGQLSNIAYCRTFTMSNITNAFKKPGIWPLNRQAFSDSDFVASTVTDNVLDKDQNDISTTAEENVTHNEEIQVATTSTTNTLSNNIDNATTKNTPKIKVEHVKPFPKSTRENKKKRKRESKSKIYTSTPEVNEIRQAEEEKQRKKALKEAKSTKRPLFPEATKRKPVTKVDEETDTDDSVELMDSDLDSSIDEFPIIMDKDCIVKVNDFVLVQFCTKASTLYYIGQVLTRELNDYKIKFLRRKDTSTTFTFPDIEDISVIERSDIIMKLPTPQNSGTVRTASIFKFKFNFKGWNVR